jgi:hypothetical protein
MPRPTLCSAIYPLDVLLMEEAGRVDTRAAELVPTCSMNDRASPARAAARKVLGLADCL